MNGRSTSHDSILIDIKEGDPDVEVDATPRPPSDDSLRARLIHSHLAPEKLSPGEMLSRLHRLAVEQADRHRPLGDCRPLRTVLANLARILSRLGDDAGASRVQAELASLAK
jgi:hypothetical protein